MVTRAERGETASMKTQYYAAASLDGFIATAPGLTADPSPLVMLGRRFLAGIAGCMAVAATGMGVDPPPSLHAHRGQQKQPVLPL
jgi:hypothetical protein